MIAFLFLRGAPDPAAPPCMRHRLFPLTAGAMQALPERVFAPQRGLASIGPVLRRCVAIAFSGHS
jgi:phage tail protein X